MNINQAEEVLKKISFNFASYPSISELDAFIDNYIQTNKPVKQVAEVPMWMSTQAVGTPAAIEAMFKWIQNGQTAHKGWSMGLKLLRISEDELFNWYAFWLRGDVHPDLLDRKKQFASKNILRRTTS